MRDPPVAHARRPRSPLLRALALAVPLALALLVPPAVTWAVRTARPAARAWPAGAYLVRLAPPVMSAGRPFGGLPPAGALFTMSSAGVLGSHFCSASVVDSPSGNLVITAAHCVSGQAPGSLAFVPGYHDGTVPYGVWAVTGVITDRNWAASSDPADDFAFLAVSQPATGAKVEDVTGGERLGAALPASGLVTAVGYPDAAGAPIICRNHLRSLSATQLEFDCAGYAPGTSGSPLLAGVNPASGLGTIVGVIGGYQRGGHRSDVSYAARFGPALAALYRAAISGSGLPAGP